jgi:hypothetical protein
MLLFLVFTGCKLHKDTKTKIVTYEHPAYCAIAPNAEIKKEPSISAPTIGLLPYGLKVTVIENVLLDGKYTNIDGEWAYIKWEFISGYVFREQLKEKEMADEYINPKVKTSLSENIIKQHSTIKLKMTVPHGAYLFITSPDSVSYYVIAPFDVDSFSMVPSWIFTNLLELSFNTKYIMAQPWVQDRKLEYIFTKNGKYKITVGQVMFTETEYSDYVDNYLILDIPEYKKK